MKLTDTALFRQQALIGGAWHDAADGARFAVRNPANAETVGHAPRCTVADVEHAITAAHTAFPNWCDLPAKSRAQLLRRWFDLILQHRDDLAAIMVSEQGKPLAEARGEIDYAASFIEWFAEEARRVYGDVVPSPWSDRRMFTLKQPVGVAALITPWNFPAAMLTRKAGAALAAGCTVVAKPASQTPFTALALAELGQRAGLPPGVLNVVTGDAATIGAVLTSHPLVRKLSFTGSTAVGKQLLAQSAPTLKHVSLELGGNAPFIVFDDADLDAAVAGALASKYRNSGQTCVCANRVFVQDSIHDAFAEQFAAAVAQLNVGDGFTPGVETGPLINAAALDKVEAHIADALAHAPRPRRTVLPADGAGPLHARHANLPRRNLRPGGAADPLCRRSGSHPHGERHRVRAGRLCLYPRPRPRLAAGGTARLWHGRHQRRGDFHRRGCIWRRQAIGAGTRGRAPWH
jgi:succinate-semialdehyde dehydrogenase / glutarate-semialdehyde dehydrogenase